MYMKIFNVSASKLLQTPNLTPGINIGGPPDILMGHGPIYMYDVIIITQHNIAEASLADFKIWL